MKNDLFIQHLAWRKYPTDPTDLGPINDTGPPLVTGEITCHVTVVMANKNNYYEHKHSPDHLGS